MLRLVGALTFGLSLALLVSASTRESGLDDVPLSDQPAPTSSPLAFNELHPSFSWESVPVNTGFQRRSRGKTRLDRPDVRQMDNQRCAEPGYFLITQNFPCCHPGFPVCCHEPSDICCPFGTFCQGVKTCCLSGSVGCGEGCCGAGTACCGTNCCLSGWACRDGTCVDPQVSKRQVQPVSKVQSTGSTSLFSMSPVSLQFDLTKPPAPVFRASASLSSKGAGQDYGDANLGTIDTVRVLPSDPRIEYDSLTSWADTTHDSGAGFCTNGTRVARVVGASFTFAFSGLSVSIQTAVNTGLVNYTVIIDGKSTVASDRTQALNQCYIITSFTQAGLSDTRHTLKVVASSSQAGKLEFAGIIFTGKGALVTQRGGGDDLAVFVGGAVGGTIGFLLLVVLGICLWVRRKNKKQQKGLHMQEEGSSLGAPRSSHGGSGESFPATAGHEQPHPPAHNPEPQSIGYSRTSRTSPVYQTPPGVPLGMSGQNARPDSGGPLRGGPPLVQPAVGVSPSTQQEVISLARRLSGAPFPIWVERARNSAAPPSQHTYTTEGLNSGPDPVSNQRQPIVDALSSGRQRPQSIHDPRYYTAADAYGFSLSSQGPFHRDGS